MRLGLCTIFLRVKVSRGNIPRGRKQEPLKAWALQSWNDICITFYGPKQSQAVMTQVEICVLPPEHSKHMQRKEGWWGPSQRLPSHCTAAAWHPASTSSLGFSCEFTVESGSVQILPNRLILDLVFLAILGFCTHKP